MTEAQAIGNNDMGLVRSATHCISVAIRSITRIFNIVDMVSQTGEKHAEYFMNTSVAELEAREAAARKLAGKTAADSSKSTKKK